MWTYTIIALVILIAVLLLWKNNLRAREHATYIAKKTCLEIDGQLLDESVALKKLRLSRGGNGMLCLWRIYQFEYSLSGLDRNSGSIELNGLSLHNIYLAETENSATILANAEPTNSKCIDTEESSSAKVLDFQNFKDKKQNQKD